jgi:YegS C-terminal NAD kinase beta sandwich-like domain
MCQEHGGLGSFPIPLKYNGKRMKAQIKFFDIREDSPLEGSKTAGHLDASIIAHVSRSLKYRVGRLAYAVSALKGSPKVHPLPPELRETADDGGECLLWQGEAWQVIFGNTRIEAGFAEVIPGARVDDGKLDVPVIAAGNVLHTLEEVVSLFADRRSASDDTHSFQGAHAPRSVPASLGLHLDGSAVELPDYLSASQKETLARANDAGWPQVEYRFDAEPAALRLGIPRTYSGALLAHWTPQAQPWAADQQQDGSAAQAQPVPPDLVETLMQQGKRVTVTGVGPIARKPGIYIIAGTTHNATTGDTSPVAVRVDDKSMVLQRSGQQVPAAVLQPQGTRRLSWTARKVRTVPYERHGGVL